MKGIYEYCHSQQVILFILLFVANYAWGFATREQSFAEVMKNPWRATFPVVLVAIIVLIPLIVQAARELNREIAKSTVENKPRILLTGHESAPPIPTTTPGWIMGSGFILAVLGLAWLAFWAGFSPSPSGLRMAYFHPPVPEDISARGSTVIPPSQPKPPQVHVVHYETNAYVVGKPLTVWMYVDNSGGSALTLFGGTHSRLVDNLPSDIEERRKLERSMWAELTHYKVAPDRPMLFPVMPTRGFFAELGSESALSDDDVKKLNGDAVMYLLSSYWDRQGRVRIRSCIHTVASRNSVIYCADEKYNIDDVNNISPNTIRGHP